MDVKLALLKRDRALVQIRDLFSRARFYGLSHSEMCDERNAINERMGKVPRWVKAFLDGYWQAETNRLYVDALEYAYVGEDGTRYSTRKDAPRTTEEFYRAGRGSELQHMLNRHFLI
jgi:hypothetical protein